MDKTLKQVQNEIDDWAQQFKEPYFPPLSMMAAITEEVGEVARILNRKYGSKKAKPGDDINNLEEEIGDVLLTLVCLANSENIDLTKVYDRLMSKLYGRDNNRFERKEDISENK